MLPQSAGWHQDKCTAEQFEEFLHPVQSIDIEQHSPENAKSDTILLLSLRG